MRQRWLMAGAPAPSRLAAVFLMLVGATVPPFAAIVLAPSLPPAHAAGGEGCGEDEAACAPAARGRPAVTADLAEPAPNRLAFCLTPRGRPPGSLTLHTDRCGPPPHHLRC